MLSRRRGFVLSKEPSRKHRHRQLLCCPVVMLSSCYVVQLLCCPVVMLSSCYVVQLLCCPVVMLSSCYVVQLLCCPVVMLSSCYVVQSLCCPVVMLSSCYALSVRNNVCAFGFNNKIAEERKKETIGIVLL